MGTWSKASKFYPCLVGLFWTSVSFIFISSSIIYRYLLCLKLLLVCCLYKTYKMWANVTIANLNSKVRFSYFAWWLELIIILYLFQYVAYIEGLVRAYNIQTYAVLYTLQRKILLSTLLLFFPFSNFSLMVGLQFPVFDYSGPNNKATWSRGFRFSPDPGVDIYRG